jgi:hypothetical protein
VRTHGNSLNAAAPATATEEWRKKFRRVIDGGITAEAEVSLFIKTWVKVFGYQDRHSLSLTGLRPSAIAQPDYATPGGSGI